MYCRGHPGPWHIDSVCHDTPTNMKLKKLKYHSDNGQDNRFIQSHNMQSCQHVFLSVLQGISSIYESDVWRQGKEIVEKINLLTLSNRQI